LARACAAGSTGATQRGAGPAREDHLEGALMWYALSALAGAVAGLALWELLRWWLNRETGGF
jgi:cytochrome oxidase assembly protein ShyY1